MASSPSHLTVAMNLCKGQEYFTFGTRLKMNLDWPLHCTHCALITQDLYEMPSDMNKTPQNKYKALNHWHIPLH